LDFKYAFHPVVELKPGETCEWKRHFEGVCAHLIWYLNSQAERSPIERFMWAHVPTIVKGINKQIVKLGFNPYSKRAVEYGLAHLEKLGIIARVSRKRVGPAIHNGFIVGPHYHSCRMVDETHCRFWCGGLQGLGFDRPGVTAGQFVFHGPACPCADCMRRYKTR
jgi:hypothetical protein